MRSRIIPFAGFVSVAACRPDIEAQLTANPICEISCLLSWSTDEPASSWVEFGANGALEARIGDDELVTDHEVVVVGLHAETDYLLQAVSQDAEGRELRSEQLEFAAGSLPEDYLVGEVDILDESAMEPGWTLANIMVGSLSPVKVVMLDSEGQPVWYYLHDGGDGRADIVASWLGDGRVLVGPDFAPGERSLEIDLAGGVHWQGPEQPGDPDNNYNVFQGQLHHVLQRLDDGTHLSVRSEIQGDVHGDVVVQFDENEETTWSWSAFDHVEYDPKDVFMGVWWTHINSVNVDLERDLAWINSWVLDRAWQVDRGDGSILWTLGEEGDFAADPAAEHPWFELAHSFDPIGDEHYLLYDNGSTTRGFSRVLEYALDLDAMRAEIVWEYPGELDDDWYNLSAGDVDLLPNGNRLVVAGTRLLELTEDRELVWQFQWSEEEEHEVRSYQAERMPALTEALD